MTIFLFKVRNYYDRVCGFETLSPEPCAVLVLMV